MRAARGNFIVGIPQCVKTKVGTVALSGKEETPFSPPTGYDLNKTRGKDKC